MVIINSITIRNRHLQITKHETSITSKDDGAIIKENKNQIELINVTQGIKIMRLNN